MDQLDFLKLIGMTQEPMMSVGSPANPYISTAAELSKTRPPKQAVATPIPSKIPGTPDYLRQEIVASRVLSPEEENLLRDLRGRFKENVVDMEAKAQALRDAGQVAGEKEAGKIDWTPMASLIAQWGGPDVTGAAKAAAPMSDQEKLAMRLKLEQVAGSQEAKVLGDIAEILKGAQGGKFAVEAAREHSKQGRYEAGQLLKKETELQKDLDKSVFTPMSEHQQTMGGMKELINKGDVASVQQALSNFARSVAGQKGVLTDADIALVYPQNLEMKLAKAHAFITSNPNVPLPPEIKQSLMEGIDIAQRNAKKVFQEKLATKKNLYSTRQSYKDVMSQGAFGPSAFSEAESRLKDFGGEPAGLQIDQSAIEAELKRRGL